MTAARQPGPLAAWILARPVGAWMRASLSLDASLVAVVLAPGVIPPELEGAPAWREVEGLRMAAAPRARAAELARGRSSKAGAHVERDPPAGCAWCLHLTAAGAEVFAFPLVMHRASAPAGDA